MNTVVISEYENKVRDIEAIPACICTSYGLIRRNVSAAIVERNWNPCFDSIIRGENIEGMIGPMYDGLQLEIDGITYKVHNRYETSEIYDMMSR